MCRTTIHRYTIPLRSTFSDSPKRLSRVSRVTAPPMNTKIFFGIFFLGLAWPSVIHSPEVPEGGVEAPEPLERDSGPLAAHLRSVRWTCPGDGCLSGADIDRLAVEIFSQADDLGLDVAMLVGILMVENPWLDSLAVSSAGAVGLYQVMPMHREVWPGCEDTMETVVGSVCHGSSIIHDFLQRRGSRNMALLAYNGCKGGPCEIYPEKVSGYSNQFINKGGP